MTHGMAFPDFDTSVLRVGPERAEFHGGSDVFGSLYRDLQLETVLAEDSK